MALESDHSSFLGFGDEQRFQFFGVHAEGDIHQRTIFRNNCAFIEAVGGIDGIVDILGFHLVIGGYLGQSAHILDPFEYQTDHIDGPAGRCVVHGAVLGMDIVIEHGGQTAGCCGQEVLFHDHDYGTGRPDVLLSARVNHGVFLDLDGFAHKVGTHIGDQGYTCLYYGIMMPFGTIDRVVCGDMHIGRIIRKLVSFGDIAETLILTGCSQMDSLSDLFGFSDGFLAPDTGVDVVRNLPFVGKVHGHHQELHAGTALQE